MKPINEVDVLRRVDERRERLIAVQLMLNQQFDTLEKIMETNSQHVQSPLSYNACAGLLEQARNHAQNAFLADGVAAAPEIRGFDTPKFGGPV
jgi:hypothetical protein